MIGVLKDLLMTLARKSGYILLHLKDEWQLKPIGGEILKRPAKPKVTWW
jgi:hypothetical protein